MPPDHVVAHPSSEVGVQLAQGGEIDAAMNLADSLFSPSFEEGQDEPRRRDNYWYKEGLKKG